MFNANLNAACIPSSIRTLPAMLEWQATNDPKGLAVVAKHESMTHADLFAASHWIAAGIRATPVQSDCIGLYIEPSVGVITAIWGILAAGYAYLPLAPEYPDERIRYIVEHSEVDTIIVQASLQERLSAFLPTAVRILVLEDLLAAETVRHEAVVLRPTDLAYVIYTSGSTGRPKGVMIEQDAIATQMHWLSRSRFLQAAARILQKTPMSFDAAQWEILAPAVGATVVVGSSGLFRDTHALIDTLLRHDVTHLQCVPTLLAALCNEDRFLECRSIEVIFSGGEALSQKLAAKVLSDLPNRRLVNLYGPTECTINTTFHEVCVEDVGEAGKAVTIGRPVDESYCLILDADYKPVPDGEEGELYIGGRQLARGYRNSTEQTAQRFIYAPDCPGERLYRTGDVCAWNPDGTIRYLGRTDHQVKLRGYRVELEEISLAIENHPWVYHASVVVSQDVRSKAQSLTAVVEMNEKEAALMDQGVAGSHHQSKMNKLQVKAQLSNPGLRNDADCFSATKLPGANASTTMRRAVFARKTYRFYEGGTVERGDVEALIADWHRALSVPGEAGPRPTLNVAFLGNLLRWFGAFSSDERLLPKYSYASPGALYATQIYVQTQGVCGLSDGIHYYHPIRHELHRVCDVDVAADGVKFHFVGKHQAIEPVYKNNIQEVLEMETGHMLAVFDEALSTHRMGLALSHVPANLLIRLGLPQDDIAIASFKLVDRAQRWTPNVDLFVQPLGRGVRGMNEGTWQVGVDWLSFVSGEMLRRRDVIAINQKVFERASLGFVVVSRESSTWLQYAALGFALHKFQRNNSEFGFMSAGYSSKTGNPLPAARTFDAILAGAGLAEGPMYFFVGGKVSAEQIASEGMYEDAVHMHGPAEMIRDELMRSLPDYMIPNRVLVWDALPLTANGKVDHKAVAASEKLYQATKPQPFVAPETASERWLAALWEDILHFSPVSSEDEFFASGGNSLIAISMLRRINQHFGCSLPAQTVFEAPRLRDLARRINQGKGQQITRFMELNAANTGVPLFCWPGLGGYPMNLRPLALSLVKPRPFVGIQSYGLNEGETPYTTIEEMAHADVEEIQSFQPEGPITLWGYSFGARLAFESAWQLERSGRTVEQLVLICPGNPHVENAETQVPLRRDASFDNRTFVAILLSVFLGRVDPVLTEDCLALAPDTERFARFILERRPQIELNMILRIMAIVRETYEFEYSFVELRKRCISAPVTIIKARGDDYSFIENAHSFSDRPPRVIKVENDHYEILRGEAVRELAQLIAPDADTASDALLLDGSARDMVRSRWRNFTS